MKYSFAVVFVTLLISVNAQTLPVGFGNYQDFLRRSQLMGQYNSQVSFLNQPLEIPDTILDQYTMKLPVLRDELDFLKTKISILSPEFHAEWNSHHPYYSNNGAMVPSKGGESLTSVGIHIEAPFLSIQFRPEIYLSQNLTYDGFPDTLGTRFWNRRYVLYNRADLPEQFGEGKIRDILPGQSHALIYYKGIGLGISSESLWWGPGKRNSLVMSNNARSFAHLTFRSQRPVKTPIGGFEWNIIAGRLDESGFDPPARGDGRDETRRASKKDDWRFLNGFNIIYSPKWVKGLSLGITRTVQQYSEMAKDTKNYLPIFINFFRSNDPTERNEGEIDQYLSSYIRWVWEEGKTEIYFEYGRNDAAWNIRDALLSPQHSRAYTFGFSKVFDLKNNAIQLSYEHTQMQQTANYLLRDAASWYMHGNVRHGYTHRGEVLGSAIGPGSNLDHLNVSYVKGLTRYGLTVERWTHDNDFHYFAFEEVNDFRRFWIDYTIGGDIDIPYKNFIFSGAIKFTRSLNYQWEIHNSPSGLPYFVNGRDVSNLFGNLRVVYLFSISQ